MDGRFDTTEWDSDDGNSGPRASGSRIQERTQSPSREPHSLQIDQNHESDVGSDIDEAQEDLVAQKILKPLSAEALAEFEAAQQRAGIIYISRIPPGMRPTKVRHLLSTYGELGRVFLKQEGMQYVFCTKGFGLTP